MEETEIPIDQIMQEQNPSRDFGRQPEMQEQMNPQQMAQMQQMMQPQQGLPMPDQPSAFGRVKEYLGNKTDYVMAIPIFLVVVAVMYFLYPMVASRVPMLETIGKVLFSVIIGIIAAVIFLVVKSKMG